MIKVTIDPGSGFCGGVIRAISTAEEYLSKGSGPLYSLGEMVHNEEELARLGSLGLVTIGGGEAASLPPGSRVIIRAHGEPPATYERLSAAGISVIDCTCPVVLRLQQKIRLAAERSSVVIFGKIGHPEVLGLLGQTQGRAVVVEDIQGLEAAISDGRLPSEGSIELFSQTTKSPEEYALIAGRLKEWAAGRLTVNDTICAQVSSRHKKLTDFASRHDVVIFVAGGASSNGKVLFELCRRANPRSYLIGRADEVEPQWLEGAGSAGVCGATSTPRWLLEQVAHAIENLH